MTHQGRCFCGHYRFTVEADPIWVAYCHCESCRRFNAAPTAVYVGYADERVTFAPASPPIFRSSPEVRRSFCEHCSTALTYQADWFPGETHLFRSNFETPAGFEPTRHVLFNEREADFDVFDDLPRYGSDPGQVLGWGPRPAIRVLFLCTQNSARSILAEGLLNLRGAEAGGRRVRGHSAGSTPSGRVHQGALDILEGATYRLDHLRSKDWEEFAAPEAPEMDWVITLCDNAAAEVCPVFPGAAENRHWGLPDPAGGTVSFEETRGSIEERIDALLEEIGATAT